MAYTAQQRSYWVTGPNEYQQALCIGLEHPGFVNTSGFYLTSHTESYYAEDRNGTLRTHIPAAFSVALPSKNANSNQDLAFTIGRNDQEIYDQINAAREWTEVNGPQDIILSFGEFIIPSQQPSGEYYVMPLKNISFDGIAITGTATRQDLLGRMFPRKLYSEEEFPGIRRG